MQENKIYDAHNEREYNPKDCYSDCREINTVIVCWQSKLLQCFIDFEDHFMTNFEFLQTIYNETIL